MSWQSVKIGDFLKRSKIPVDIKESERYKRVTIRGKHKGVSLRDFEAGKAIGTKKQFFLKEGQFVLSKIDARYGAFGIAPAEVDDAIITGNFWAYDVDKERVNIEWFNQYTNSPIFYDLCERASSGITHRKYLDEKFFLNHTIDLPSIEEQESVICLINEQRRSIRKVSTELDYQLALAKELRKAYLREAMQGKLVPQEPTDEPAGILLEKIRAEKEKLVAEKRIKRDKPLPPINSEETPFEIPSNWIWCRFGEILNEIKYGTSKSCDYDSERNSPVLRIPNVSSGVIDAGDLKYTDLTLEEISDLALEENDILIIRSNGSKSLVGETALVTAEYVGYAFAGYLIRLRFSRELIQAEYLMAATNSAYFRDLVEIPLRTTVGINNINTTEIANLLIPLAPLTEQARIVAKLEKLMKFCDELEANIKQGIANADRLLQTALREALEPRKYEAKERAYRSEY